MLMGWVIGSVDRVLIGWDRGCADRIYVRGY